MHFTDDELNRKITARDAFNQKFCVRGQRKLWNTHMEPMSGIPYEVFVREGVSARVLLETDNPYAITLIKRVLGKEDVE